MDLINLKRTVNTGDVLDLSFSKNPTSSFVNQLNWGLLTKNNTTSMPTSVGNSMGEFTKSLDWGLLTKSTKSFWESPSLSNKNQITSGESFNSTSGGNTPAAKSSVFTAANIANAGAGALGMISQNIAAARPAATEQDLINNAQKSTGSIDGFSFTTYGDGGEGQAMAQTSQNATANTLSSMGAGAAAGASFGPWGAAIGGAVGLIGGLFSGGAAKRRLEEAIRRARIEKSNKSETSLSNATTLALRKRYAEEYGDQERQQLFQAANGKRPVWSFGGLVDEDATGWVSNGEIIGNLEKGVATRIPGRKNNKDTKLAALSDGDFVISNKYGLSDYAAATGDYLGALNLQETLLGKMRNKHGYKNGKLPGFNLGAILPSLFNAGVGIDLIARSKNLLSAPSSYVAPLTNLRDLHEISMSMLPIYANNRNVEARTRNAIVKSGGLGAGLIASALAANTLNTQLANSQALQQGLMQNNQYKANAITANYQADAQEAARKTAAGQWDYDKYASAHNAAEQQRLMGLYNIANAWREGYKNLWDREQFEKTYGLYFQDMKNKEMYYRFLRNGGMDKPTNDLKYSKLRIDNNGLYGLRNTPDTLEKRSELYKKYQVEPFSMERLNSIVGPKPSLLQLIAVQDMLQPGWNKESKSKSSSIKSTARTPKKNTKKATRSTTVQPVAMRPTDTYVPSLQLMMNAYYKKYER